VTAKQAEAAARKRRVSVWKALPIEAKRLLGNERRQARDLYAMASGFVLYMDSVMKSPATVERGKAIAAAVNTLDMRCQQFKRFSGLVNK